MTNDAVISTEERKLLRQESLSFPELLTRWTLAEKVLFRQVGHIGATRNRVLRPCSYVGQLRRRGFSARVWILSMPALKCSFGIQRKRRSGWKPLRRGKMPRPLFGAEPKNSANIVCRARGFSCQFSLVIRVGIGYNNRGSLNVVSI